jgi:hypothetical protein
MASESEQELSQATRESPENQPLPEGSNVYQDHSLSVPLLGESAIEDSDSQRFPPRLFRLLDRADEEGFSHVDALQFMIKKHSKGCCLT